MSVEDIQINARREDGDMLIRRFVSNVGYDYIQHSKENTAKVHPDFSDETRIFWKEIEERLQKPVVIGFDREKCIARLREEGSKQAELCSRTDSTSSYHYGLKQAYYDAIRIVEGCLIMNEIEQTN